MFGAHVIPDELRIDSRDPLFVDGPVWLTLGSREFPSSGWTDAGPSVLGSMGQAVSATSTSSFLRLADGVVRLWAA